MSRTRALEPLSFRACVPMCEATERLVSSERAADEDEASGAARIRTASRTVVREAAFGEFAESSPRPAAADGSVPSFPERTFYLHVTDGALRDPRQYARVRAVPLRVGRRVAVYLDLQEPRTRRLEALADSVIAMLEDDIAPRMAGTLGATRDVDRNGRFLVLLTPWLQRLQGGRTTLKGFVRSTDFLISVAAPFSNRCDMLYLNSAVGAGPALRTLLAHEYAHAVCVSERLATGPAAAFPQEEDWLNEAIAHVAENLYGGDWSNLDHRIDAFLEEPQAYPLVIDDYYRAGLWRNHGCRGATYLFLRWCVDHCGHDLLGELVRARVAGRRNLARATGVPFATLFRYWSLALAASSRAEPPLELTQKSADAASASTAWAVPCRPGNVAFRSIDLRGRLGEYVLRGVQTVPWPETSGTWELTLPGTGVAFVSLRAGAMPSEVLIDAEPGCRLQVSVWPVRCSRAP